MGVAWLALVLGGMGALFAYKSAPGAPSTAPGRWPAASAIAPATTCDTLLVFAHPRCPCTRATISDLATLMARAGGRVDARVLVLRPHGVAAGWERTDLWESAAAIPGVSVSVDEDGAEARRFGASTSGQALLYARTGELLFAGGLTASRGHEGDNVGCDTIEALVAGRAASTTTSHVYGCGLSDARCEKE